MLLKRTPLTVLRFHFSVGKITMAESNYCGKLPLRRIPGQSRAFSDVRALQLFGPLFTAGRKLPVTGRTTTMFPDNSNWS